MDNTSTHGYNNKPKEKIVTKKYKIKDVFDKNTYPKHKQNKIISIVKKTVKA